MTEKEKVWKPLELVKVTADYLAGKQIPNSRMDAEVLLCDVMGLKRRVDLYAGFEREISGKELGAYRELIKRRAAREPVSRILGRREFMGLDFKVTMDVLSPRSETELLVETVIEAVRPKKRVSQESVSVTEPAQDDASNVDDAAMPEELARLLDSYGEDLDDPDAVDEAEVATTTPAPRKTVASPKVERSGEKKSREPAAGYGQIRILDLGTGSGCIAVATAAMLPEAIVMAVDASPAALAVAKENAKKAGVADRMEFRRGDWFAACREGEQFDFILSNPPYLVKDDPEIWPEVALYDPPAALYGGSDGLDCYRRIVPKAGERLKRGGEIMFEVGMGQAERVVHLLEHNGFTDVKVIRDYGGTERVIRATRAE